MVFAELAQATEEGVDPELAGFFCEHFCGQGEGEEGGQRGGSHGGEVAEAACKAAVTDGLGWLESAAEVAVFKGKVGGDEDLVTTGRVEDGAVVTYAEGYEFAACGEGRAPDLFDQG